MDAAAHGSEAACREHSPPRSTAISAGAISAAQEVSDFLRLLPRSDSSPSDSHVPAPHRPMIRIVQGTRIGQGTLTV